MKEKNKFIFAPDSFKGTVSSRRAGEIMGAAFRDAARDLGLPMPEIHTVAMADGGEGTTEALGAEMSYLDVVGPDPGQTVHGFFGMLGDTAVVELAAAAAITQTKLHDPLQTTTYGVGQLISAALDRHPRRLILAIGGSATNDGGCGMATALGVRFTDADGNDFVPTGGTLKDIAVIDVSGIDPRIAETDIEVMCDVTNTLCGESGASAVFGPQKGADPDAVRRLDAGLQHLADVWHEMTGDDVLPIAGGGAAGGCGAGAVMFLGAKLRGGADVVLDAAGFDGLIDGASLVVTGEGRFDATSVGGKAVGAVAARCRVAGVPCIVLAGAADPCPANVMDNAGITAVFSTQRAAVTKEELAARAEGDMYQAAYNMGRMWMRR